MLPSLVDARTPGSVQVSAATRMSKSCAADDERLGKVVELCRFPLQQGASLGLVSIVLSLTVVPASVPHERAHPRPPIDGSAAVGCSAVLGSTGPLGRFSPGVTYTMISAVFSDVAKRAAVLGS